ncbi:MAG: hypothetical protein KDN22_16575 [Verrucomicrobiae bacterium]|nr:hypothetical protein [Verrucomicrobiae bacterium]
MKTRNLVPALALLASLVPWITLSAQDEPAAASETIVSGPKPSTVLTPIRCADKRGEFDVAEQMGTAPGAILFVHELTRNTAPVINGLDQLASDHAISGFRSFTILLNSDRTAGEDQAGRVNGSLNLRTPIVLCLDGAEGPGNYALNRNAALTLIYCNDGKVQRSEALTDTGPNDVPKIRAWAEEITGSVPMGKEALAAALPDDAQALRDFAIDRAMEVERLQTQLNRLKENRNRGGQAMRPRERPAAESAPKTEAPSPAPERKREGKPPEDSELNGLLRSFIRQTNDDTQADEVFAKITKRAEESSELTAEAVEMFKLMLSFRDRYGTEHAQSLAEGFLKEHAK